MQINFNKQAGQRILEIGCGDQRHPEADCAVDSRKLPCVDFVVDLNLPFDEAHGQAIGSGEFDAVLSRYSLEHVSWRNFRGLLKEICRVLKPGGKLVAITANLFEQAKMFVERCEAGDFDDRWVCQIFGDQNYGPGDDGKAWLGNAHFVGWHPTKLETMLREAGFAGIKLTPLPEWKGDLVVEAMKSFHPGDWTKTKDGTEGVVIAVTDPGLMVKSGVEADPNNTERWKEFNAAIAAEEKKEEEPPRPPQLPMETTEQRAALFGRKYFDGGPFYGPPLGCWDTPHNAIVARRVLDRLPKSVLELGCGRGYVLKRLQDAGIHAAGMDISKHAQMTRACDYVTLWDACQIHWGPSIQGPWPIGHFDMTFSLNFWEYIPEEFVPVIAAEMERCCQRGLHGISFDAHSTDKAQATIRDRRWWKSKLPRTHEIVDARELRDGPIPEDVLKGDGRCKVAIGTFITMSHYGWINVDTHDLAGFAQSAGFNYLRHDVRQGLPFGTQTVDLIAASHFLEHLNYNDGLQFLRECRRVLKPTGAIRLAVPNSLSLAEFYADSETMGDLSQFDEISNGCANRKTAAGKLWETLMAGGHQALYDWDTLHAALNDAGFKAICAGFRQPGFDHDGCRQILRETVDVGVSHSLFAAAIPAIG